MTHVGRRREHNEDAFFSDEALGVFAVCDGLGGQAAGEIASRMACEVVRDFLAAHPDRLEACRQVTDVFHCADIKALLGDTVQAAHAAIRASAAASPARSGMACTIVLLLRLGDHVAIAHLGDSRAYLRRRGRLHALTRDHNFAVEAVHSGNVTLQEVMHSSKGGRITKCLGCPSPLVEPDILVLEPMNGDQFLLCSDGVTTHLNGPEILEVMQAEDIARIPEALVAECNACGGTDNITALVVGVSGLAPDHDRELSNRILSFRKIPFFSRLDLIDLARVFNRCIRAEHLPGDCIIKDGDDDHRLFVCLSGKAEVRKKGVRLASVRPGDAFGEMALLENAPRSADVVALKPTVTLAFDRADFVETMHQEPWMAIKMLFPLAQHLNHRLRSTNDKLGKATAALAAAQGSDATAMCGEDSSPDGGVDAALEQVMAPGFGEATTSLSEDELQAFETALYGMQ